MAGFTLICNDCGNKLVTGDDCKAINDVIEVETTTYNYGTVNEFKETVIWCANCGNSTDIF